jgi:hypothetical protein
MLIGGGVRVLFRPAVPVDGVVDEVMGRTSGVGEEASIAHFCHGACNNQNVCGMH